MDQESIDGYTGLSLIATNTGPARRSIDEIISKLASLQLVCFQYLYRSITCVRQAQDDVAYIEMVEVDKSNYGSMMTHHVSQVRDDVT